MAYSFKSRVRFSELGEDRKMTLNSIINYYQDCSNFESEEAGCGLASLESQNRAWLLSSWQICVNRYPVMGEPLDISTWAYDFKGFYGYRNFLLKTEGGELLSYANSLWIFMDTEAGKPARINPEDVKGYKMEEKLPMEYAPRKVTVPDEGTGMEPFTVKHYHLDVYHHVNNGQYIQMAREYLPEDFKIRQMRVEYKKQAVLDSVVIPVVHKEESLFTVALCAEDGNPYAVVKFQ